MKPGVELYGLSGLINSHHCHAQVILRMHHNDADRLSLPCGFGLDQRRLDLMRCRQFSFGLRELALGKVEFIFTGGGYRIVRCDLGVARMNNQFKALFVGQFVFFHDILHLLQQVEKLFIAARPEQLLLLSGVGDKRDNAIHNSAVLSGKALFERQQQNEPHAAAAPVDGIVEQCCADERLLVDGAGGVRQRNAVGQTGRAEGLAFEHQLAEAGRHRLQAFKLCDHVLDAGLARRHREVPQKQFAAEVALRLTVRRHDIGNAAFGYMLPILAGFIAMSIADRPGLAVGFAGGVLAMNGTNFAALAHGETTGISGGFLAALLAGFAAGCIVQFLKKITEKLPASLNGIRPMLIYPLGGILIIGAVMCGINPVMGIINTAMTDWLNAMGGTSKVLLGAIVAGMMSIDMGGPFNKAAYVFGTAALASGNYGVMAAVMVGGMVPPIAIALSTTFCPKKWSPDERRNGIVNYVMGLCFVTEGAIPYAAADPLRVLPSCIIGSALAGSLSMVFGCALRAPHGGIFVFPVVDHALLYIVALIVGSVVGAVILSLLKKEYVEE